MKKRNGDPQDLIVAPGESVTISVRSDPDVLMVVNYVLNGQGIPFANPLTFTPSKDPSLLTALFTFTVPDGQVYFVTIEGSGGGDVARTRVRQLFGTPFATRFITFDIEAGA
jgi:hypothetical protein